MTGTPYESVRLRNPAVTARVPVSESPDTRARSGARRFAIYVAITLGFGLSCVLGSLLHEEIPFSRVIFAFVLFACCAAPVFMLHEARHRVLVLFCLWYFLSFGFGDAVSVFLGAEDSTLAFLQSYADFQNPLSMSDFALLLGILCAILGYRLMQSFLPRNPPILRAEWNQDATLAAAASIWFIGQVFSVKIWLTVTPLHIPSHIFGLPLAIASNLAQVSLPAVAMFIYLAYTGYRPRLIWAVLTAVILIEMTFGFLSNSRTASYRVIAMMLATGYLVRGKINIRLVVLVLVTYIPYGMMFNVYRSQVLGPRNDTPLEALQQADRTADVLEKGVSKADNVVADNLRILKDRVNCRYYVDIIVSRSGVDVPYLHGTTLMPVLYSLIPRLLMPDKPDIKLGQMFNQEFGISLSSTTFVPTTMLGELYWNFGFLGLAIGMGIIGAFLGFVGTLMPSLSQLTVARFVVVLLVIYQIIVRFEASIGNQFSITIRFAVLVALLHFLMITIFPARNRHL